MSASAAPLPLTVPSATFALMLDYNLYASAILAVVVCECVHPAPPSAVH